MVRFLEIKLWLLSSPSVFLTLGGECFQSRLYGGCNILCVNFNQPTHFHDKTLWCEDLA